VLEDPAQERTVKAARLERQVAGVGLLGFPALFQPRQGGHVGARGFQLAGIQIHPGDAQLRETAQQDLALCGDATADFQHMAAGGEVDIGKQGGLEQPCLLAQPCLLGIGKPVQIGKVVVGHGSTAAIIG